MVAVFGTRGERWWQSVRYPPVRNDLVSPMSHCLADTVWLYRPVKVVSYQTIIARALIVLSTTHLSSMQGLFAWAAASVQRGSRNNAPRLEQVLCSDAQSPGKPLPDDERRQRASTQYFSCAWSLPPALHPVASPSVPSTKQQSQAPSNGAPQPAASERSGH